ncbi:hypothetical protein K503DRAFT_209537 [Rhizopogon vinicolor AM-OR11-026]|uniref:Uncharacterized protein n=1 Tax=Rhizopogon vinicolor AM-OR11-026 TaxID=1314800 RepID=A0A1B7MYW9_9AGAM|nr:hypothetical protein K503DRAFT_209537 [Rhizopogon vinicolor AM-OR11-026]
MRSSLTRIPVSAYTGSVFGVHLTLSHRALTLSQLQRLIGGMSYPATPLHCTAKHEDQKQSPTGEHITDTVCTFEFRYSYTSTIYNCG